MTTSQTPSDFDSDVRSRHIPHSVFGIGAIVLVLLAALVLILLSGHMPRSTGAVLLVVVGVPAMIAFATIVAQRWRRARLGRVRDA